MFFVPHCEGFLLKSYDFLSINICNKRKNVNRNFRFYKFSYIVLPGTFAAAVCLVFEERGISEILQKNINKL